MDRGSTPLFSTKRREKNMKIKKNKIRLSLQCYCGGNFLFSRMTFYLHNLKTSLKCFQCKTCMKVVYTPKQRNHIKAIKQMNEDYFRERRALYV